MKFVFEYIGFQRYNDKDLVLALIRTSGTTGNIIKDHDEVFTFSAFVSDNVIVDFQALGTYKEYTVGHRAGFKTTAYTHGYKTVTEGFLNDNFPGLADELIRSASEGKVFHKIKYSGNREAQDAS